ncbi:MAG: glutathionylspermidine synthase family protein [Polyangiaceae bacterium]|nr:glutathionylspermidine synthase family protein [Polyangiaceae bacterium]
MSGGAAEPSEPEGYDTFAKRLLESRIITDPWLEGRARFAEAPIVLEPGRAKTLADTGRRVAELYDEGVQLVADDPPLLESFFGLTPVQRAMFQASQPLWHGIARADIFFTSDGVAVAELNCDTPTGEAEAVVLGELARAANPTLLDPNQGLPKAFLRVLDAMRDALVGPAANRVVGIVYPTEFTEDLSLVRLYKKWLEGAGFEVALGSPYNLRSTEEDATCRVFDEPVSTLVRHYKTDWWSERASAWDDEALADTSPLTGPLYVAMRAHAEGKTAVVNPFGSVVPQNKRMMAFMWENIHRFSLVSQDVIRELIPITSRLESLHPEMLKAQRESWVIKSDFGAEGDEVVVGRHVDDATWNETIEHARSGRWVAQRYFEAELDPRGQTTNFGVFVCAGEPAGLYARVQAGPTDEAALSTPVLIRPRG